MNTLKYITKYLILETDTQNTYVSKMTYPKKIVAQTDIP